MVALVVVVVVVMVVVVVVVVVVVLDTIITRQVYVNQPWHELATGASTPKRRQKNAEKYEEKSTPSSQESATWSSKSTSSFPSANCAEQLGTLLQSTEWRKNASGSESAAS